MNSLPQTHQNSLGWLLNAATLRVNSLMRAALQDLALTQGQFAILKSLAEEDNLTQIEIGRCVDMPAHQMTRQLDALETRGLLGRFPDPHSRRSTRIKLTEEGRALAPQLFDITKKVNETFARELSTDECLSLCRTLKKLVDTHPKV